MPRNQLEFVGRWVTKLLPKIAELALSQSQTKNVLSDHNDINILFAVFSEYYGVNFPECVKRTTGNASTDYRMKFVTLFLSCYEPQTIHGPFYTKLNNNTRSILSKHLYTSGSQISQYLPKVRFYTNKLKGFDCEIQQMVAMVKLKQSILDY